MHMRHLGHVEYAYVKLIPESPKFFPFIFLFMASPKMATLFKFFGVNLKNFGGACNAGAAGNAGIIWS